MRPLVSGDLREEHDTGLVRGGVRREDVACERQRRSEDRVVAFEVAGVKRPQAARRRYCDRVEDAEKRIAVPERVAANEFGVMEIVAGVHSHAGGKTPPERDLTGFVQ